MSSRGRNTAFLLPLLAAVPFATPAVAGTAAGGMSASPTPAVSQVLCRSDCAGVRSARAGSILRVRGRHLAMAERVVFHGGPGDGDDVDALPRGRARAKWLDVPVPRTAVTGPVTVINADGAESRASSRLSVEIDPRAVERATSRASGSPPAIDVELQGHKVFYGAQRPAELVYLVRDEAPVVVHVELVRVDDGSLIARWSPGPVPPNTPQSVIWDGTAGGVVQREGRYEFRVYAENGAGLRAQTSAAPPGARSLSPTSFVFLRHKFPVRANHEYGDGFGAGRNHQGVDVFARCGTPLVAARGGIVKIKATHGRAGHYVVIDGDGTGVDYVYMHLREPAVVDKGDHVFTGQVLGAVGDTGRARGCHLHFELWDQPGWYTGGRPFDPLPSLRNWDAHS